MGSGIVFDPRAESSVKWGCCLCEGVDPLGRTRSKGDIIHIAGYNQLSVSEEFVYVSCIWASATVSASCYFFVLF